MVPNSACDYGDICFSGTFELIAGLGVSVTLFSKYVFDCSVMGIATVKPGTIKFCASTGLQPLQKACAKIDVVAQAKLISFIKVKYTMNVLPEQCL
ncbi:MAG: hypothetical protein NTU44_08325 [Bacteroidetes bacterium]|nr:hypothetical protein [Bacteroidota bacterium]